MDLLDLGFIQVGAWNLDPNLKSGIRFSLSAMEGERVIYGFVVGEDLTYIGVCENSMTNLKARMYRYQSRAGAGTNTRIAKRIKEYLLTGEIVKIFALCPNGELKYKGVTIDLVKGLENPLVKHLNPDLNIQS